MNNSRKYLYLFLISDFKAPEKKKIAPLNSRKPRSQVTTKGPVKPRSQVVKRQVNKRVCKPSKSNVKKTGVKNMSGTGRRAKSMCSEVIKNGICSHVKEFLKKINGLSKVPRTTRAVKK